MENEILSSLLLLVATILGSMNVAVLTYNYRYNQRFMEERNQLLTELKQQLESSQRLLESIENDIS